jgi:flagellar biosynthetic protein FlhB
MAENDTSQERTEEATPKRREEARTKGQISRSRELTTMFLLMTSAVAFLFMGKGLANSLQSLMQTNFTVQRNNLLNEHYMINALFTSGQDILLSFAPLLLVFAVIAFFAPMLVGGWLFSPEALAFKPDKLNPISGI